MNPPTGTDAEGMRQEEDDLHADVAAKNSEFYGRYPYPWPAASFAKLADRSFGTTFLNQELGYFTSRRVVPRKIWVAGCGTNQAVITALQHPDAWVIGTDLSQASLAFARRAANNLGIENLTLVRQDLLEPLGDDLFDLIVCTGVVHHNPDPERCLERLRSSLSPDGVVELMVYFRHHRWLTGAFQEALRTLLPTSALDEQLDLTRSLLGTLGSSGSMRTYLEDLQSAPTEVIVDSLMQPVEHSYTVATLQSALNRVGLRLLVPRINAIDSLDRRTWNTEALADDDGQLAARLANLNDIDRWSVTSLLLADESPMLWFYVDRTDSPFARRSERDIRDDFLKARLSPYSTTSTRFIRQVEEYSPSGDATRFPPSSPRLGMELRALLECADGSRTSAELMDEFGIRQSPGAIDTLRAQLTTIRSPYLAPQLP